MQLDPRRSLTHPLWLAALGLLALNDHVLKGAGILPQWLTGKLSDFVGMLVAPALLACVAFVRTRRGLGLSHAAVGAGFAAIKLFPAAAHAVEVVSAATPFPWVIVVDPTDLLALPMLGVSYWAFADIMSRAAAPSLSRSTAELATLSAGMLACLGTSPPPCEGDCAAQPPMRFPQESAMLLLGNTSGQQRIVHVRPLRDTVVADCSVLLADPTAALTRELFAPAETWLVEPGRALPLKQHRDSGCEAFLVDAQGLEMTLLAWSSSEFPTTTLETTTDVASERMIPMREIDGHLELDPHAAVFEAPPLEEEYPEPACSVPPATVGIAWSEVSQIDGVVEGLLSSPDGCHELTIGAHDFYVCLPLDELPFEVGEQLRIASYVPYDNQGTLSGAEGLEIAGATTTIRAVRGDVAAQSDFGGHVELADKEGCDAHHDECGDLVRPLELTVVAGGVATGSAGDALELADGGVLHIVRAQRMPIRDTECAPELAADIYLETVLVFANGGE